MLCGLIFYIPGKDVAAQTSAGSQAWTAADYR